MTDHEEPCGSHAVRQTQQKSNLHRLHTMWLQPPSFSIVALHFGHSCNVHLLHKLKTLYNCVSVCQQYLCMPFDSVLPNLDYYPRQTGKICCRFERFQNAWEPRSSTSHHDVPCFNIIQQTYQHQLSLSYSAKTGCNSQLRWMRHYNTFQNTGKKNTSVNLDMTC